MRDRRKGRVTALLGTALLFLGGCGKAEETIYEAGLTKISSTEIAGNVRESGSEEETDGQAFPGDNVSGEEAEAGATEKDARMPETDAQEESEASLSGYVYVCGAVQAPGVYPVYEGMRVWEAIELAGGFSEGADEEWLNLVQTVADGERLYVYTLEETAAQKEALSSDGIVWQEKDNDSGAGASGSSALSSDGGKVNLNTATREELMTLPGIGEAKADAILSYREEHGGFQSAEEIQNISGIKSGVYEKIKDQITV